MELRFDIVSVADALAAEAVCRGIADALGGEGVATAAAGTRRSTRRAQAQPTASAAPVTTAAPAEADALQPATAGDPLLNAYNSVAAKLGADPIPVETPPVVADPAAPAAAAAEAAVRNRTELEAVVRSGAIERGINWVRDNVFNVYSVKKIGELTDAQLAELAAKIDGEAKG